MGFPKIVGKYLCYLCTWKFKLLGGKYPTEEENILGCESWD
jgi:hypothetical protein